MKKHNKLTTKMTTKKATKKAAGSSALIQSLVEKDVACLASGPAPVCGGVLNC
jgi:hypothetical protein